MTADILREAAAKMRERAERADALRFWPADDHDGMDETATWQEIVDATEDEERVTAHTGSWSPAVALAVADLLDGAAELARIHPPTRHGDECPVCGPVGRALTVARAYLGGDA